MPSLKSDDSIPTSVWREATGAGKLNLADTYKFNIQSGGLVHLDDVKTHNVVATVVGLRNGNPWGQDSTDPMHKVIQLNPYPYAKSPFLSKSTEDLFPRMFSPNPLGGTAQDLTNLSSLGGTPLAIALDTVNEVQNRAYNERMRMDPRNPLSAAFAAKVMMKRKADEISGNRGPFTDVMDSLFDNQPQDEYNLKSRIAAGYSNLAKEGTEEKAYLEKLYNQTRDVAAQDLLDFKGLFKGNQLPTVNNAAQHMAQANAAAQNLNVNPNGPGTGGGGAGNINVNVNRIKQIKKRLKNRPPRSSGSAVIASTAVTAPATPISGAATPRPGRYLTSSPLNQFSNEVTPPKNRRGIGSTEPGFIAPKQPLEPKQTRSRRPY